MRGRKRTGLLTMGFALVLLAAFLTGCATTGGGKPENLACGGKIQWDVAPEGQITNFECALGTHGGEPALIFNAAVKNVTDQARRYRINVFLLDMDKAAGHLVPRKGKPPVVEPGAEEKVKIPFIKTDKLSNDMLVVVKTISL